MGPQNKQLETPSCNELHILENNKIKKMKTQDKKKVVD